MVTAALAGFVVFSLSAGAVSPVVCGCLSVGAALLLLGGHDHGGALAVDGYARKSRFFPWNAGCKALGCGGLLALCVASPSPWPPLGLAAALGGLTALAGGLGPRRYAALLRLPTAFLLLSALALLWDYGPAAEGVLAAPLLGGYLVVTPAAQAAAGLVLARALGAVSCLYFLSLSTTVPEIVSLLRRCRLPGVVTELAVLIYRYIFVLLSTYGAMRDAAESRLGYGGLRRSLRTTGAVYGNLLARSFRRAGQCFDAMESRCFDGEIRFLEERKPVTAGAAALFGLLWAAMAAAVGLSWRGG